MRGTWPTTSRQSHWLHPDTNISQCTWVGLPVFRRASTWARSR